jgi:hypothetical protein
MFGNPRKGKWFQWITNDSMKGYDSETLQNLARRREK